MYLNDHSRASFYESLGLDTTQFNRYILCFMVRRAVATSIIICTCGQARTISTDANMAHLKDTYERRV